MPHDVKTSLPQIDWQIGDTITITLDNPAATIVSLAIRVVQESPGSDGEKVGPFMLVPGAQA